KTIQYLRQKLEALNIPIYGGTVTYLMLPQAKGDVKDHNLKIHEVWDAGSGNSSNLLLDFSELDSSSVKYERIELDAYRIIMKTTDDRRVIKCGANLFSSDYC